MNITREVILDLLPLYLAGEASPATRTLVEEYLAQDAEVARMVRDQKIETGPRDTAPPDHDLELRSLLRTRRYLGVQKWLFALAITFSAVSLTTEVTFHDRRITKIYLLIFDYPLQFGGFVAMALGCWIAYILLRRRLRSTSL
jgi:predicted anti-sigma-YlaC factor YlaD